MGVVLTAGGRTAETAKASRPQRTQAALLTEWDRAVTQMLKVAAESAPARQRIEKMQAWLTNDENHWHDKYDERYSQYWIAKIAECELASKLFEMSIVAARIQDQFDDQTVRGMSALVGMQLYPHVEQKFAIWAQRIGSEDLFEIVRAIQMDEYVADKAQEERMRMTDDQDARRAVRAEVTG